MAAEQIKTLKQLEDIKQEFVKAQEQYDYIVYVCGGAGCVSSNCELMKNTLIEEAEKAGLSDKVKVYVTGCMGTCAVGPVMLVTPGNYFYTSLTEAKVKDIVKSHLAGGKVIEAYTYFDKTLDKHVPKLDDINFFKKQVKIALRNCGAMAYGEVAAYIARDGYQAACKALTELSPQKVIDEVKASGLKGRGGAGFPTGVKWQAGHDQKTDRKFIVCNADEGDPGAFMDRSIIEGDPHTVIEGMMLGGYAIGATQGYIYIRAEYPIAVERMEEAMKQARACGLLGKDIFGSGFDFDLEIRIGAGAFVCGEETALMASVEGQRGEPKQKPPFPFQRGLFGCPTIINNVETFANVPAILLKGAPWYAQYGTEDSKGTKVFALAGDVVNTGIIEVPIGIPIGEIIFDIGGGVPNGKKFKAAQIGGPSGGCITAENLNTPTDYKPLQALGAIMGSGGLIIMNEDTCMVDTARFFMDFIRDESCGKCTACRVGTKRMLEILERIVIGEGVEGDVELLEELGEVIQQTAMCGLGQTAPNPVLSTIKYFRNEYDEHIRKHHCRAGVCSKLFLAPCSNTCPAGVNIPGYMSLISAGRFVDAYELVRQDNPLPAICGRVCTRPCEAKCRRGTVDESLAICDLKRFVSDYALAHEEFKKEKIAKNGKRVGIIGAGPSGLSCAHYLARKGYDVDIFEAEDVCGGVLAFGIPAYRLPKDVINKEVERIKALGVNIHLNQPIGKKLSFKTIINEFNAVYIAIGAQVPQKLKLEGEELKGVMGGLDFLKAVNLGWDVKIGEKVAVIGGGNTAIDSARTAKRLGAKQVTILYRRDRDAMPAENLEIEEAIEEGVEIMEMVNPVRFIGADGKLTQVECVKMTPGAFDRSGRRRPVAVEGSNFKLDFDTAIAAVSQHADLDFVDKKETKTTPWDTFVIDEDTQMTSMDGVFAGGDVVRGPDDAIHAIADGKQAASAIDCYLGGDGVLNKGAAIDLPVIIDEDEIVQHGRFPINIADACERSQCFEEVNLGFHKLNAVAESMRCLHCERRN
ncbi:MAG TPA: NADH-ubiquinone oxidoreductase-F iron-sulfur binding region domain-containing protein [Candidatus Limiplasma sp.]|nr:NADH-ubiquinone oxidoreductase-F iron-sulfur binding region domain-containing protein [Candidatus Limiplasma sp.]